MTKRLPVLLLICTISPIWAQQTAQPPATASEINFIKHMLISIASPIHDPKVNKLNEEDMVRLYGLNSQETAILQSAGQSYATAIKTFQAQRVPGNQAATAAASATVDQTASALANQILNAVRPQTATIIRVYAAKTAAAISTGKGGN